MQAARHIPCKAQLACCAAPFACKGARGARGGPGMREPSGPGRSCVVLAPTMRQVAALYTTYSREPPALTSGSVVVRADSKRLKSSVRSNDGSGRLGRCHRGEAKLYKGGSHQGRRGCCNSLECVHSSGCGAAGSAVLAVCRAAGIGCPTVGPIFHSKGPRSALCFLLTRKCFGGVAIGGACFRVRTCVGAKGRRHTCNK